MSVQISFYDEAAGTIAFPYATDEGIRYESGDLPFGEGLTSRVIQTRAAIHIGSMDEPGAEGAIQFGLRPSRGSASRSWRATGCSG